MEKVTEILNKIGVILKENNVTILVNAVDNNVVISIQDGAIFFDVEFDTDLTTDSILEKNYRILTNGTT